MLDSAAVASRSDIETSVRLTEEALADQLLEQHLACRDVYLPEPTRLRKRQPQPGHFAVLTPNTSDKPFKRRRIVSARHRTDVPAAPVPHSRPFILVKHLMNKGDSSSALTFWSQALRTRGATRVPIASMAFMIVA
jgi:hypothetical protein